MRARGLAIALAALLLSGCFWEGPAFYRPDPAQSGPLSPGLYKLDSADKEAPQRLLVRRTDDGALLIAAPEDFQGGKPSRVVLMPLAAPGRHLWIVQTQIGDAVDPVAYGLLESDGAALILDPALDCQGSEALVRKAGGTVEGEGGSPSCLFADRAALERALIAYAAIHPDFEKPARLTRIRD
ncbi:MAG: hypothetical protein ABI810_16200 [Sphingomonas bacterium]